MRLTPWTRAKAADCSEAWRRTGADHPAGIASHVAEAMRAMAFKKIGVGGAQYPRLAVDGDLQLAGNHDSAFLAPMPKHDPPTVCTGRICLHQDLELPT